jgi:hypothetical protein
MTFKAVTGWTTPADQGVTVIANTTVVKTGTYTQQVDVQIFTPPFDIYNDYSYLPKTPWLLGNENSFVDFNIASGTISQLVEASAALNGKHSIKSKPSITKLFIAPESGWYEITFTGNLSGYLKAFGLAFSPSWGRSWFDIYVVGSLQYRDNSELSYSCEPCYEYAVDGFPADFAEFALSNFISTLSSSVGIGVLLDLLDIVESVPPVKEWPPGGDINIVLTTHLWEGYLYKLKYQLETYVEAQTFALAYEVSTADIHLALERITVRKINDDPPPPTPLPTLTPVPTPKITPNYPGNSCQNAYSIGLNNQISAGVSEEYREIWFTGTATLNGLVRSKIYNISNKQLDWQLFLGSCSNIDFKDSGKVESFDTDWSTSWYPIEVGETAYMVVWGTGTEQDLKSFEVKVYFSIPTPTPSVYKTPPQFASPTATVSPIQSPSSAPSATPSPRATHSPSTLARRWIYDYNGDGTSDIAVFRCSLGMWLVRNITQTYFGSSTDYLVPGDYNGDGTSDIAIFRDINGLWSVKDRTRFYSGSTGDIPVQGAYNGDDKTAAGIFRESSGMWSIRDVTRVYWGSTGDTVIPGYYNADDTKDIAVFRGSSGMWSVRNITRFYFGSSGDDSVPGDYNGDGTWEAGIYRVSAPIPLSDRVQGDYYTMQLRGLSFIPAGQYCEIYIYDHTYDNSAYGEIVISDKNTGQTILSQRYGDCGSWVTPGDYAESIILPCNNYIYISMRGQEFSNMNIYFGDQLMASGGTSGGQYPSWQTDVCIPTGGTNLWASRGVTRLYFGSLPTDQPVAGDYNGDTIDDIGIFQNNIGLWTVRSLTRLYFGSTGDIPVTR